MTLIQHAIPILPQAAGTSVFCGSLCENLVNLGVDSRILLPRAPARDDHRVADVVPIGVFSPNMPVPDLIHLHALWHPYLHTVASWGLRRGVPLVFSPHGMLTTWALEHRRWKKMLAMLLYQRHDLVASSLLHATSDSEVEDIRRLGLRQPVMLVPLGVHVPAANDAAKAARRDRSEERTVLFVSRIHRKKGLLNLIRAWALLKRGFPRPHPGKAFGWRLVVAGPDEEGHRAEVEALARSQGLSVGECPGPAVAHAVWQADVTFTGAVFDDDKASLYQRADLFVLPSYSENFGAVVTEALAAGVPVITTKGTPWRRLEEDDHDPIPSGAARRAGWWIDIGVEPLQLALREAMQLTDEERAAIGAAGRRLVQRDFSWQSVAADIRAAYAWLLHGGQMPKCVDCPAASLPAHDRAGHVARPW